MLNKLLGREVNALFCSKCMSFSLVKIGENQLECPVCYNQRKKCNLKIKRFKV